MTILTKVNLYTDINVTKHLKTKLPRQSCWQISRYFSLKVQRQNESELYTFQEYTMYCVLYILNNSYDLSHFLIFLGTGCNIRSIFVLRQWSNYQPDLFVLSWLYFCQQPQLGENVHYSLTHTRKSFYGQP